MTAEKELERLEREIADTSTQAPLSSRTLFLPAGKQAKPRNSLDLILVLAASLAVIGVGVNTVRQMPDQQAKSLRDGLLGDAAGLLVGYPLGSFRPRGKAALFSMPWLSLHTKGSGSCSC